MPINEKTQKRKEKKQMVKRKVKGWLNPRKEATNPSNGGGSHGNP